MSDLADNGSNSAFFDFYINIYFCAEYTMILTGEIW